MGNLMAIVHDRVHCISAPFAIFVCERLELFGPSPVKPSHGFDELRGFGVEDSGQLELGESTNSLIRPFLDIGYEEIAEGILKETRR